MIINSDYKKLVKISKISFLLKKSSGFCIVNFNKILGEKIPNGIIINRKETINGINFEITVENKKIFKKPIFFCFGMINNKLQTQKINIDILLKKGSSLKIIAYCSFPQNTKVTHIMKGKIKLEENANLTYLGKHIHNKAGTTKVNIDMDINMLKKAKFKSNFEMLNGKAGFINLNYHCNLYEMASAEMKVKLKGYGNDKIKIKDSANLIGKKSKCYLESKIAVKDCASALVYNKIVAKGEYAKGHINCIEILQDNGNVKAYPVAEVLHPKARITHEASLGGVDNKQLDVLMAKGLSEKKAEELIIQGMLT